MMRSRRGQLLVLLMSVLLAGLPLAAHADGEFQVAVVGTPDASGYPNVQMTLDVVEAANGRAVDALDASGVEAADAAGPVATKSLHPSVSRAVPVAYLFLVDTSSGMGQLRPDGKTYLQRATEVIRQLVSNMGPNDQVRLVAFNNGADSARTNWVRPNDQNFGAALGALFPSNQPSLLVPALQEAAALAASPPPGIARRAIVAFVDIDGRPQEPGLELEGVGRQVTSPTFTFGAGAATPADERATLFLDDLAKATGGGYWGIDGPPATGEAVRLLLDITHRTWDVVFLADGLPDGHENQLTVTVRDGRQHSGVASYPYQSGSLGDVSAVKFRNLADNERVTSDRKLVIEAEPNTRWRSTRLDLYRDCSPPQCSPIASADDGSLEYLLTVGGLDQGEHELTAVLLVSDGTREFSSSTSIGFVRGGTSWNFLAVALIAGLALAVVTVTGVQMQLRSRRGSKF